MPRPKQSKNVPADVYRTAVLEVLSDAPVPETAARHGITKRRLYRLVREARREYEAALEDALEEVAYWREVESLIRRNGREA